MFGKLLLALALVSTVNCQCSRSEDKYIGDLCYRISNEKFGFQDAALACHEFGLNLAVIKTTLQANFLASMVGAQSGGNDKTFWIGLSRPSLSGRFTWDDGTTMYWSNFDMNMAKNDLFVAESITNGKWQTLDGTQQLYYVCSYDPKNVTPGTATPGYPASSRGYPMSSRGYPASTPGYPASSRGYPASSRGYPASTPGYPASSRGYPASSRGYPASSRGYPGSTPGYPASSRVYPASSRGPYTPGQYSTGYPASQTPSEAPVTGYPMSHPASDSTGYPGSQRPSGAPATGYPASVAYSDSTGYPASQTWAPVSDSSGSYQTGNPASQTPGYPVSSRPQ